MSDFKIQIERLGDEPRQYTFEASPGWWAARGRTDGDAPGYEPDAVSVDVQEPFRFDLEARSVREDVLVEGVFAGRVELECSRCAKRYPHALHDVFRLVLEPASGSEPTDPEGERSLLEHGVCLGEDLEAGWYRGPVISLDDFFAEVVALAMPIQPLCDEACPGICPHCGADRASTQCDCVDEKIDSPFAVLAALKIDKD